MGDVPFAFHTVRGELEDTLVLVDVVALWSEVSPKDRQKKR